jgi:ferric-dicitrate binding protein FerR (iron transport regulator)
MMDDLQKWFLEHASDDTVDNSWEALASDLGDDDYALSSEAFNRFKAQVRKENPWWRKAVRVTERVAAILLLPIAVAAAVLLFKKAEPVQWTQVYTQSGQTQTVTLPDGSLIRLAPESHILYPSAFRGEVREIYLEGEAYADITHMEKHPFHIHAEDITVKVFGTEFNFSAYPADAECELALVDGSVELGIAGEDAVHSIQMKTGDMVRYERETGSIDKKRFSPDTYLANAKRDGLQFANRKMEDIGRCLERKFGARIIIEDDALAQERFFASFINNEDLPSILEALNTQDHMTINKKGDTYHLSLK